MQFSFLAATLLAGCVTAAKSTIGDYQVVEQLSSVPAPWARKDAVVDSDLGFKLRIHLKNNNVEAFQKQAMEISTPDHPDYGRHMSKNELRDILAPSKESFDAVLGWLEVQGLTEASKVEGDWVIVETTLGDVEELLQAEYLSYTNAENGRTTVRTLGYSLPAALHSHIDLVAPTTKFPSTVAQRSTLVQDMTISTAQFSASSVHDGLNATACNITITPDCLKALYKFEHFRGSRRNGNQFILAGFLEEYAQHDDLAKFLATYDTEAVGSDFKEIPINGGLNTQQNTTDVPQSMGEANLDMQYGLSLAYPTPIFYTSTGGRPPETTPTEVDNEPYLEFLTALLKMDTIPQTISISYGDGETTVPNGYANTVCDLFSQLAARGVTVMVSSGDSGSGSDCTVVSGSSKLQYAPAFPASCPWVTAVGATYHVQPEIAVPFSGGGFSNYFAQPSYQKDAVNTYLTKYANASFNQYFNASGRAYPDISAQGVRFHVVNTGVDTLESGTSASAPAYAAVVALLNSDRISNGLAPFGFLNPWLYSKAASAHTDITGGKGSGCSQVPGSGFPATVGWDPVTGLGTPDFKKLRVASTGIES